MYFLLWKQNITKFDVMSLFVSLHMYIPSSSIFPWWLKMSWNVWFVGINLISIGDNLICHTLSFFWFFIKLNHPFVFFKTTLWILTKKRINWLNIRWIRLSHNHTLLWKCVISNFFSCVISNFLKHLYKNNLLPMHRSWMLIQ